MDPHIWGPPTWDLLFYAALSRHGDHESLIALFQLLPHVLPCDHCRASCEVHLSKLQPAEIIDPGDDNSAARWLYCIKDITNQKLGKTLSPPFSKVEQRLKACTQPLDMPTVLDVLQMLAVDAREDRARQEQVLQFCKLTVKLLQAACSSSGRCPAPTRDEQLVLSPALLADHIGECTPENLLNAVQSVRDLNLHVSVVLPPLPVNSPSDRIASLYALPPPATAEIPANQAPARPVAPRRRPRGRMAGFTN